MENGLLRNTLEIPLGIESLFEGMSSELALAEEEIVHYDHQQTVTMIEAASREIKEKARRRKEEEKALQESQASLMSLSADGKPEQFPFKNIKPKKAFLLGGDSTADTDTLEKVEGSQE